MLRVFLSSFFAVALLVGGAWAQTTKELHCKMLNQGTRNWIAPDIFLFYTDDGNQFAVWDAFAFHYNDEKPVAAQVTSRSGGLVKFVWRHNMRASNGTVFRVRYNGELEEAKSRFKLTAMIQSTAQNEFATGTCTVPSAN